ncbi:MAG: polysaccharide biosynthesis/export family protein, partial [Thiohalocapsa sp.]
MIPDILIDNASPGRPGAEKPGRRICCLSVSLASIRSIMTTTRISNFLGLLVQDLRSKGRLYPRRWLFRAGWQVLGVLLSACSIGASPPLPSESAQDAFVVNEKSLAFNTASALAAFNSPPAPTYQIGPGDKLMISVWERPELSGEFVVGPDGYIGLPVAGPIKLAGFGREETHQLVTSAFSRFYEAPIVTVDVTDYVSNRILILGRVTNPGALQFTNPPTLLEAITLAGGLPVGGLGSEKATLTRCAVFRGRDRVVWLNLKDLLAGRNLSLNLQLRSGDLVYIPDADD